MKFKPTAAVVLLAAASLQACGASDSAQQYDPVPDDTAAFNECLEKTMTSVTPDSAAIKACFSKENILPQLKADLKKANPDASEEDLACGSNKMYEIIEKAGGFDEMTTDAEEQKKLDEEAKKAVESCNLKYEAE